MARKELPFRSAIVSTLAHTTEDENLVLKAVRNILPEKVEIRKSKLKGHHGNPIVSFEARATRREFPEFWRNFMAKLPTGEFEKLRDAVPKKIDDDCYFYVRFDKQLAHSGELALTESGDAIHLKLKVMAYPAKREVAIGLVRRLMEEELKSRSRE